MMRHRWIFLMKVSCDLRIDGQALQKMRLGLMCLVIALLIGLNSAHAQSDGSEMLPMFGQPKIARPDNLKQADEAFIRDTTLRYGSRQAASNALATQGWAAIRAKQGDVAMQRFNQAWLLNPKNYSVFWGFGAVLSERGKLAEAIEQLETARELTDDSTQRTALLCDLGTVHSEYAARMPAEKQLERAHHFVVANNRFTESLELNPKYAPSWREWAISLYAQERYSEAWIRVRQARALDADPFPPEFLKKLSEKMSEPK
ncbi:MAG: tetratricopeptide repeat protein [Deltaproteobacteria bacterium]|nr:MAG: tetratricopeptide repeat protein [Deltaproteobacteria bacterium]